ncbi:MAG: hypothetical protein WBC62_05350 [Candidatus Macondimonas sp.]
MTIQDKTTAWRNDPDPRALHVGILGIHGPEATASLQALLEHGATITAWSRQINTPWAQRLARRGVSIQTLPAQNLPPEMSIPFTRPLDWLLIFPGARLARGLPKPERIPEALYPRAPGRIVQLIPAGLALHKTLEPCPEILNLSTVLVLERWLNAPMRRAIDRGQLPFPPHRHNALPLISAHRIAQVILALCVAKLSPQQVTTHLAGEWVPLPVLLDLCRERVGRPVRLRNRSVALVALRMGREMALMAHWIRHYQTYEPSEWELDALGLEPVLEGMRRLPW